MLNYDVKYSAHVLNLLSCQFRISKLNGEGKHFAREKVVYSSMRCPRKKVAYCDTAYYLKSMTTTASLRCNDGAAHACIGKLSLTVDP